MDQSGYRSGKSHHLYLGRFFDQADCNILQYSKQLSGKMLSVEYSVLDSSQASFSDHLIATPKISTTKPTKQKKTCGRGGGVVNTVSLEHFILSFLSFIVLFLHPHPLSSSSFLSPSSFIVLILYHPHPLSSSSFMILVLYHLILHHPHSLSPSSFIIFILYYPHPLLSSSFIIFIFHYHCP